MNCDEAQTRLPDYLTGDLTPDMREAVSRHLESCDLCRGEAEIWRKMAALPDEAPPPEMRDRFYAMLERETARKSWWRIEAWWPSRPVWQFALAASMLVVGWFAGRLPVGPASSGEVAELRQEVRGMRETMALALLQQSSASERLKGVSYCATFEKPEAEVISALLRTLALDQSVDVRLAAIDALRRYRDDAAVRRGLAQTLAKQESPMVQVELIQALAEQGSREAVPELRRMQSDPNADESVRERAGWALEQLGKVY